MTEKDKNILGLKPRENSGENLRVDQCYICRTWQPDNNLLSIDIPDQGSGWVEKKCCQSCFDKLQSSAGPDGDQPACAGSRI